MVVEGDAEGSAFLDFFQVFPGEWVEIFEEVFADECGDTSVVPVAMAPKDFKVFWCCPCRLIALCRMGFLDANHVGLSCKAEEFVILDVLPDQVVC